MFDSIREFGRRYPSLVAAAIILFIGFSFAVYKMSTAFADREATPEYQNRPAAGLSPPPASSIVDPQYITGLGSGGSRLPDDDYTYILTTSNRLSGDIARRRPGLSAALSEAGLPLDTVGQTVTNINDALEPVSGQSAQLIDKDVELSVGSDGSVIVSIPVVYTPGSDGSSTESREGIISLSYRVEKGKYRLDDVQPPEVY